MLLFIDSFDHYVTADITEKWTSAGNGLISAGNGRNSTASLRHDTALGSPTSHTFSSSHATGVIGFAVRFSSLSTANAFCQISDGATLHLDLSFNSSGQIRVRRGDGTVLATGTTVFSTGVFFYIEFKFTINDSTGAVEVRLNGSGSAECSASSIDTRNGGNSTFNKIGLQENTTANTDFDDLYVCDGSGSVNNNFLGDCRVECLFPSTGNGSNTGLTPSTGTDHGALVDESAPNNDTDYNSSNSVGTKDTYNYPSLNGVATTIHGVQTLLSAAKNDAGARSVNPVIRHSGVDYDGTSVALSTSYLYYHQIYETNPGTAAAWTVSDVNGAEFGMKVAA